MPGMDHILSKGFVLSDAVTTPVALGQAMVMAANTATNSPGQAVQVAPAANGANAFCIGLAGENIDLIKVQTGKAFVNVALLGITKAIASGAIAAGAPVENYSGATTSLAGYVQPSVTAGNAVIGIAMEAAVAQGDIIDVLLTPGVTHH